MDHCPIPEQEYWAARYLERFAPTPPRAQASLAHRGVVKRVSIDRQLQVGNKNRRATAPAPTSTCIDVLSSFGVITMQSPPVSLHEYNKDDGQILAITSQPPSGSLQADGRKAVHNKDKGNESPIEAPPTLVPGSREYAAQVNLHDLFTLSAVLETFLIVELQ
ncbi:hypothetical protein BT96DRAFT_996289 [Gymnopus androsaceus JB14]|uniref:Uncharacterized protein n=1 Tax=Gymnopus androsaceus JB14 TaxID=1447944 RepID=A0A6A4HJ36_9AGAR|nr:hypothetical protein BT96DRAFT_996289 [Gymnopus androsaceus JB14]